MPLIFNPKTGLSVDDTAVVRDSVRADWIKAFAQKDAPPLNVAAETPAGQLIDSQAALVAAKDSELMFLANMFNPEVAEGVWQDALGKIYFQARKTDDHSVVTCTCSGRYGTVIPDGSIVQTDDGHFLDSTAAAAIGASGTASVIFRLRDSGAIAVEPGTVNTIITVIPGWDTVSNPAAGTVGRLAESRAEFEARRRQSVALNAHGSAISLYAAVAAVDGVLDCRVLENDGNDPVTKNGVTIDGHSVCISVYGGEDEDIAAAIYSKKDGGCGTSGNTEITYVAAEYFGATYDYNILRPTPTPVMITANIVLTDDTPSTITQDIKDAIIADFTGQNPKTGNARVSMASRLYASRFYPACILTAGVVDLVSIEVALDTGTLADYVDIMANQEPTLSEDDITVSYQTVTP